MVFTKLKLFWEYMIFTGMKIYEIWAIKPQYDVFAIE